MLEEGRHPALITENEWTTAQSLLNGNRAVQTGRSRNLKNPLAGLIVCGRCGKAMVRRPYAGKKQDYLVCTTPGCNNIGSNLHLITEKAKYAVANWLAEYDFSEIFTDISQPLPAERNGELHSVLEQTYSRYQRQMDRAYDLLEQDVYTVAVFETRKRRLEQRLWHSFNMLCAWYLGRLSDYDEIGTDLKAITGKMADFVFVLVIRGHKMEWLLPLQEELRQKLKYHNSIWNSKIIVMNDEIAREYHLII